MSITIPDEVLDDPRRLLEETLCAAWSQGKISGGNAARHLEIGRIEFWKMAGARGYPWPYFAEDLRDDIATMKRLGQW